MAARQAAAARKLVIVAGPTASGKSALALRLAQGLNGVIINADAMQCYRDLRILTARPSAAEEAKVPHRLYGVLPASTVGNAAWWREAALDAMRQAAQTGQIPILCGGTGLYLRALLHGIADIPEPPPQTRTEARALLAQLGPAGLHAKLAESDPTTAARLHPADSQRVTRAYEVWRATGRGLAEWQADPVNPLSGWSPRMLLLDPPRPALHGAIATRFAQMLQAGALAELRALLDGNPDPGLPLLRALGVPELTAYLRGECTEAEASARAVLATYRYTRRQGTWFRHQRLVDSPAMQFIVSQIASYAQLSESFMTDIYNFINTPG